MLNDHHRIAAVRQPAEDINQLVHIRKMQSRGRLIQDIDGLARAALGQFGCQLDTLGLTA